MTRAPSRFAGTFAVCCAALFGARTAQSQPAPLGPPHDRRAEVLRDRIVFSFPLPYREITPPHPPKLGFYAWRVTIESEPALSIVLTTSEPMRTGDYAQVLEKASLRLCPSTTSTIAECTTPIEGRGRRNPASIKIELTDKTLVNRIRKVRPEAYWRTVIEPGGHFLVDQVFFIYRNR